MNLYHGCSDEEFERRLKNLGSPYAPRAEAPAESAPAAKARRKRRRR
jgi:hypothetical protein